MAKKSKEEKPEEKVVKKKQNKAKPIKKVQTSSNLVPFPSKLAKEMGIQIGDQGVMVDKKKLGDFKKFTRPKADEPDIVKEKVVEEKSEKSAADKQRDIDKGIY